MLETTKQELRQNWFKLVCLILISLCVFHSLDDIRTFLKKPTQPQIIMPANPQQPQFITPQGNTTVMPPPMIVTIPQTTNSQTTVGVKEKPPADPKNPTGARAPGSADVVLGDTNNKYIFEYDGGFGKKTFQLEPTVKEDYKFQNGQLVIGRTTTVQTSVSVPTPIGGIGIGMNLDKKPVVAGAFRLGHTSANLTAVTDGTKKGTSLFLMNTIYK